MLGISTCSVLYLKPMILMVLAFSGGKELGQNQVRSSIYRATESQHTQIVKPAMFDGNPVTIQAISQGRSFSRAVRAVPPLASPLCWTRRRRGFGVEPTYKDEGLFVERKK